jgi:hypothetical protein
MRKVSQYKTVGTQRRSRNLAHLLRKPKRGATGPGRTSPTFRSILFPIVADAANLVGVALAEAEDPAPHAAGASPGSLPFCTCEK